MKPVTLSADPDLRRTAWRIGIQTAALLMASLVVVGAVVYAAVISSQNDQMAQALTAAAVARAGGDPDRDKDRDTAAPSGGVHTAVLADGQLHLSRQVPAGLPDLAVMQSVARDGQEDQRTVVVASGRYRVLTVRRSNQVVQAMASLFEQHQERERILAALGLAGGAGVVMSTLLGAFLARRTVRPMADALELQRRFVADAGHELRTPLTLLNTRAQLLHRRLADPAARRTDDDPAAEDPVTRDVNGILADSRALSGILEELLLAADTRTPLPSGPVDVAALAQAVVASAQVAAEDAHVSLDLRVSSDAVIEAGSPTAVGRAITALIDNAVSHATSQVIVEVGRRGSSVVIEVTDNGGGIPEAVLPRMFTRFASDRPSTAAAPAGRRHYGLGLSLVSEIAARHRGKVTARNRPAPATGALLRLELPCTAPPPGRPSRTTSGKRPGG